MLNVPMTREEHDLASAMLDELRDHERITTPGSPLIDGATEEDLWYAAVALTALASNQGWKPADTAGR